MAICGTFIALVHRIIGRGDGRPEALVGCECFRAAVEGGKLLYSATVTESCPEACGLAAGVEGR